MIKSPSPKSPPRPTEPVALAAELHVHANSLRDRLRRACDVSGLRLNDPRGRALVQRLLDQGSGHS